MSSRAARKLLKRQRELEASKKGDKGQSGSNEEEGSEDESEGEESVDQGFSAGGGVFNLLIEDGESGDDSEEREAEGDDADDGDQSEELEKERKQNGAIGGGGKLKSTPAKQQQNNKKKNKKKKKKKGKEEDIDAILESLDIASPKNSQAAGTSSSSSPGLFANQASSILKVDVRYLDPMFEKKKMFGKRTVAAATRDMAEESGAGAGGGNVGRQAKRRGGGKATRKVVGKPGLLSGQVHPPGHGKEGGVTMDYVGGRGGVKRFTVKYTREGEADMATLAECVNSGNPQAIADFMGAKPKNISAVLIMVLYFSFAPQTLSLFLPRLSHFSSPDSLTLPPQTLSLFLPRLFPSFFPSPFTSVLVTLFFAVHLLPRSLRFQLSPLFDSFSLPSLLSPSLLFFLPPFSLLHHCLFPLTILIPLKEDHSFSFY